MSGKRIMDIEVLWAIAVLGVLFHHLQGSLFTDPVLLADVLYVLVTDDAARLGWDARATGHDICPACLAEAGEEAPKPRPAVPRQREIFG